MKPIYISSIIVLSGLVMLGSGCDPVTYDAKGPSDGGAPSTPAPVVDEPRDDDGEQISPEVVPVSATSSSEVTSTPSTPLSNPATPTSSAMNTEKLAFPGVLPASETTNKFIHIKTNKGNIVFELLPKEGPNAASNFVYLTKKGFYNGLIFHRVEPGFVIQGGDPLGQGYGGPGYQFEDDPVHLPYSKGIVAMANAGPNTNGSQFFIMLGDTPLPPSYSVFGRVISGQNVVDTIQVGDKMESVTVESKK